MQQYFVLHKLFFVNVQIFWPVFFYFVLLHSILKIPYLKTKDATNFLISLLNSCYVLTAYIILLTSLLTVVPSNDGNILIEGMKVFDKTNCNTNCDLYMMKM